MRKTHCKNGHEFTVANTYLKKGARVCRTCKRNWASSKNNALYRRNYYQKNRTKVLESIKKYHKTIKGKLAEKRKKEKFADKILARQMVYEAVKSGKLIKKPCSVCGELKAQGHHEDYTKPLDVIWLCSKHHVERHRLGK